MERITYDGHKYRKLEQLLDVELDALADEVSKHDPEDREKAIETVEFYAERMKARLEEGDE